MIIYQPDFNPNPGLLQYWYTQSVSMDGPQGPGVYDLPVWAPRLEGRFVQIQLVDIGDPPQLPTPEPTIGWIIWGLMIIGLAIRQKRRIAI